MRPFSSLVACCACAFAVVGDAAAIGFDRRAAKMGLKGLAWDTTFTVRLLMARQEQPGAFFDFARALTVGGKGYAAALASCYPQWNGPAAPQNERGCA